MVFTQYKRCLSRKQGISSLSSLCNDDDNDVVIELPDGVEVPMKNSASRWAFCLGFLVGALGGYFFLSQVQFELRHPVLAEAPQQAAAVRVRPTTWSRKGLALINAPLRNNAGTAHRGRRLYCILCAHKSLSTILLDG